MVKTIPGECLITIPSQTLFDEENEKFIDTEEKSLRFCHSLYAISLWESKYKRPFLTKEEKTTEEIKDYYLMMCLDDISYSDLTPEVLQTLTDYMGQEFSATVINSTNDSNSRRIMTSEVMYAYMANAQIPSEFDMWNISRLLKLLGVIGELNSPPKQKPQNEVYAENRELNKQRKEMLRRMKEERLRKEKEQKS